jgi:two-component system LytT family response regulator
MKTLIIEDEIPAANKLKKLLASIDESITVLEVCRTIESSVNWLNNNPAPELILMDIELTDGKSFLIFEQVKIVSPVVFITAYDQYAINVIKLHALDYLLKPVTKQALTLALEEVKRHELLRKKPLLDFSGLQKLVNDMATGKKPKKLAVNTREGITMVVMDDILRLEADSNYTHIYLNSSKKITVPRTLKEYDELLAEFGFYRVHNAHIVNLNFVDRYVRGEGGYVIMKDGTSIEVSQLRKKDLLAALMID